MFVLLLFMRHHGIYKMIQARRRNDIQERASPSALFVPHQLPETACFLSPIIVQSLRGELDYTNLEVMQLSLFTGSPYQLPSVPPPALYSCFLSILGACCLVWPGVDVVLGFSLFLGRMIKTTLSSRQKALASPCQPAERLQ